MHLPMPWAHRWAPKSPSSEGALAQLSLWGGQSPIQIFIRVAVWSTRHPIQFLVWLSCTNVCLLSWPVSATVNQCSVSEHSLPIMYLCQPPPITLHIQRQHLPEDTELPLVSIPNPTSPNTHTHVLNSSHFTFPPLLFPGSHRMLMPI